MKRLYQRRSAKISGSKTELLDRHSTGSSQRPNPVQSGTQQGFVLLEVLLALALFSLVGVGMTQALDQIAKGERDVRREAALLRVLESVIAEVSHQPEIEEDSFTFPTNAQGVAARAEIIELELENEDGHQLERLFAVRAEAWLEDEHAGRNEDRFSREMVTYVYAP